MQKMSKRAKLLRNPKYVSDTMVARYNGLAKILGFLAKPQGSKVNAEPAGIYFTASTKELF